MRTDAHWFGPPERPLLGWVSAPVGAGAESGVLILAPIGYSYWSSHRTLRVLAECLAAAGHLVLRFDYDGTGDSAGDQWESDRLAAWRASARAAADELRRAACRRLTLVGAQLGGLIALLDGAELGADEIVAWEPVVSGRRHAKEIRLLSTPVPADGGGPCQAGSLVSAGVVFTAQTLTELASLSAIRLAAPPAPRVVIVSEPGEPALIDHLRDLGCRVEAVAASGREQALATPAEDATVPGAVIDAIRAAVGAGTPGGESPAPGDPAVRLRRDGATLTEEVVALGAHRLVGLLTRPADVALPGTAIVFLNAGSEPHVGPGRAWVEYARSLAVRGYASLRVDFRGWGESPDDGRAPGRPYDAHGVEDAVAVVRALRDRGHPRVALAGVCAGAWIALQVALREPVAGVIALNPQLYWRPGDPVEALMSDTRARRAAERRREERGGRWGLWSALDACGHRPWAASWLDRLAEAGVPVLLLFAAGDDGIEYLRNRVHRRLRDVLRRGTIRVVEIPEIDHSMHRTWLRDKIVTALEEQLARVDAGSG